MRHLRRVPQALSYFLVSIDAELDEVAVGVAQVDALDAFDVHFPASLILSIA